MGNLFGKSVQCPHCGKIFIAQRVKTCKNCGKVFVCNLTSKGGTPPQFCSDDCRIVFQTTKRVKYRKKGYWKNYLPEKINDRITYLKSMLENKESELTEKVKNAINKEINDLKEQLNRINL